MSGPNRRGMSSSDFAPFVVAAAVIPVLVLPDASDAYVRPKIVGLWLLLGFAILLGPRLTILDRARLQRSGRDIALALFLVLSGLATAVSVDPELSFTGQPLQYQGFATTLLYAGWYLAARGAPAAPTLARVFAVSVAVGLFAMATYAVLQDNGIDPYWGDRLPLDRVASSIGQPNALAAALVTALPVAVYGSLLSPRWPQLIAGGLVAVTGYAVLLTNSRGGYLALAVSLPLIALAVRAHRRDLISRGLAEPASRRENFALLGLLLIFGVMAAPALSDAGDRVALSFETSRDYSQRDHLDQWEVAIDIALQDPMFGTGPETFPLVFPEASRRVLDDAAVQNFDQFRVESPHNVLLGIAAGSGVPSLVAFFGFIGLSLRRVRAAGASKPLQDRRFLLLVATALAYLVSGLFITPDLMATWTFWTVFGFAAGAEEEQVKCDPPLAVEYL